MTAGRKKGSISNFNFILLQRKQFVKALLLIDIQNDFLPGGALAVPEGDVVIGVANQLMDQFDLVVATQDWHPAGHHSFASEHPGHSVGDVIDIDDGQQVLWPDHCIQHTTGAEFANDLNLRGIDHVVQKGTDVTIDSYSGFFDNARRKQTGLDEYLGNRNVKEVHVVGLATDYCVKFTVIDAIELGYKVTVHRNGVRGVEIAAGDCEQALEGMAAAGAVLAG